MSWSDPIADMMVRIRNAHLAKQAVVEMPYSKLKGEVIRILKKEGYVSDFVVEGGGVQKAVRVYLKYETDGQAAIRGLKRQSRPGLRKYVSCDEIQLVLGGMGTAILTTSSGVMTGREARKKRLGGELICTVW
jgi:small subunit ribosomal protein S8